MRSPFALVLAALLLPVALSAQKVPPVKVSLDQARSAALTQVRGDLAAGKLNAWGGGQGGGIKGANLKAAGALFNPTGGKSVYVLGVTAPNTSGHVRVIVDAATGAVLDTKVSAFQWGVSATPDWWVKGLNAPPAEKKGEDTLSAKARTK